MTIRELAAQLGLSKTTVADALRGNPVVSSETREWVQKRARELNYKPNPVASAFLQQVRSKGAKRYQANLAYVPHWKNLRSPLYLGALKRARELGYNLDLISRKEYDSPTLNRILRARGVLGIAVTPLNRPLGHLTLDWSDFATVALGYTMVRPAMHRVVHNHLLGMRTLFRICRRRGFRRIGLALQSNESDVRSNGIWSASFHGLQQKLLPKNRVTPFLVPAAGYTPERINQWIRNEKPDAIIFHTLSLVPNLPQLRPGAPNRIASLLLDHFPDDPHAGIDQCYDRLGTQMIDLLSLQILHNERGIPARPIITMIDGEFVDHPSLTR